MIASIALFAAFVVAVAAEDPPYDPCLDEYIRCDFGFRGHQNPPTHNMETRKADRPFTPWIVSRDPEETIGAVNSNGFVPEFIFDDGSVAKITDYGNPNFTSTSFKPFTFPFNYPYTERAGIGHEIFQGDQLGVAKGKCIRVSFSSYQLLYKNKYGRYDVIENKNNVSKSENKCVVFKTYS